MAPPTGEVLPVGDRAGGIGSLFDGAVGRGEEAGIEVAIHSMRLLWEHHLQKEE